MHLSADCARDCNFRAGQSAKNVKIPDLTSKDVMVNAWLAL